MRTADQRASVARATLNELKFAETRIPDFITAGGGSGILGTLRWGKVTTLPTTQSAGVIVKPSTRDGTLADPEPDSITLTPIVVGNSGADLDQCVPQLAVDDVILYANVLGENMCLIPWFTCAYQIGGTDYEGSINWNATDKRVVAQFSKVPV